MAESTLFKISLRKAMAECSQRELCISEIRTKLNSWGLDNNESDEIINLLIKENFINEERFATAFVQDKFNFNKWGKSKIASHLRAKNIPGDIIRKSLDILDTDLYKRTLSDLLSAHSRTIKSKNKYDLRAKLLRFGLSKGFESSLLYDLLNDLNIDSKD